MKMSNAKFSVDLFFNSQLIVTNIIKLSNYPNAHT